jgi:hypothetical protein
MLSGVIGKGRANLKENGEENMLSIGNALANKLLQTGCDKDCSKNLSNPGCYSERFTLLEVHSRTMRV